MGAGASTWSDAEIALMRRLWNDEGKTAEEIASAIGKQFGVFRTRNAVLGKIARMPDAFRSRGKREAARDAIRVRRIATDKRTNGEKHAPATKKPLPVSSTPFSQKHSRTGKTLVECGPRDCRFPVAEREGYHLFCAVPVSFADWRPGLVGGCYCAVHRGIALRDRVAAEAA